MKLKCDIIKVDVPNENKRVYYPKSVVQKAIDEFNRKPEQLRLGELDPHSIGIKKFEEEVSINLERVSHKTENAYLDNDVVCCDIIPLDTPNGKILKDLNEKHLKIKPRMIGNVDEDGVVQEAYIIAFDIVQK